MSFFGSSSAVFTASLLQTNKHVPDFFHIPDEMSDVLTVSVSFHRRQKGILPGK